MRRQKVVRQTVVTAILIATAGCASSGGFAPAATSAPPATDARSLGPSPTPTVDATPFVIQPGEPWIVYHWVYDPDGDGVNGHGVYMVRPDGRDQHLVLAAAAGYPDWSPDGKRIAVEAGPVNGTPEIWIADANGTNVTVITCDGAACGDVARPAWSPDGRQLAFQRGVPRRAGEEYDRIAIVVLDLATGATRVVAMTPVAGSEYVEYIGPRWSSDGTQIVFAVASYPNPPTDENILGSSIAVVRADGSEVDEPRILTDRAMFGGFPDWSRDGLIVFSTYDWFLDTTKASNLYTIRPDGTGLTQVTHFGENDTRAALPTWTSDGARITFTHIERNPTDPIGDRHIAVMDADGSNLVDVPHWFGAYARMRPAP
jgi:Tol biopolymer transport system component